MLEIAELLDLENEIKERLDDNLLEILTKYNRMGELEDFLAMLDMKELLENEYCYDVYKTGTIIVIGQSEVKPEKLLAVAKELGISKERFKLLLNYDDAKKFNFKSIQWQPKYSLIMVGPMPHSGKGKDGYASIISALEHTEGYPPVVRLGTNELRITKSDFRTNLKTMIESGRIA